MSNTSKTVSIVDSNNGLPNIQLKTEGGSIVNTGLTWEDLDNIDKANAKPEEKPKFSNSPLICYTRISPNSNVPRNHDIDTITIHTMAGNLSVETCGELFAQSSRQASSNYGIDNDGRIALYVEEKNRTWCSSNKANDHRAVTIEVASINTTDFACSEAAWNSLLNLCADICKRNNIKKLLWKADKSLIGKVEEQNMTVHRWFANKTCPGEYLYSRMGLIASTVNSILDGSYKAPIETVPETENEEAGMYNFLKSKGINNFFIFGLMGNLWAESGIRANNLQNSYEAKLGSDIVYTANVDKGIYSSDSFIHDKAGYGYAQWTFWSRKEQLWKFKESRKCSIADPAMQRDFLWQELTTIYKGMVAQLNAAKSLKEATDIVLTQFEKPANQSDAVKAKRLSYAEALYNKYATNNDNTSASKLPYQVRVIDDCLNIRKGPGTSYEKTGKQITDHGVYTIINEVWVGNTLWGELKSGAGWICLTKYTQKI